jgi:hypothetical protein
MRAVVQASSGDKAVASEYMGDVCDQPVLAGWKQERCRSFGHAVTAAMSKDTYKRFDAEHACDGFWNRVVAEDGTEVEPKKVEAQASESAKQAADKARMEDQEKESDISKKVDAEAASVDTEAQDAELLIAKVKGIQPTDEARVIEEAPAKAKNSGIADVASAASASIAASKRARAAIEKASQK